MGDLNLLSLVTFLPLIGAALLVLVLRGDDDAAQKNAKRFSLLITLTTFALSLFLLTGFDPNNPDFQFVEEGTWLAGLKYKLGVDGISLPLVMLTTFFFPICIGASWALDSRVKEYMALFLLLETMVLGVFVSLDLILFYLFFEAGLIPMFLIIGIWGGANRVYAAFKFFLYTLLGSVLMLIAMLAMIFDAGTTDVVALLQHEFATDTISLMGFQIIGGMQTLLFLAFFASFAVKMPMWPVHTWLPDAHVQAPTAGSIV
ncbi:MAG: NADH-quinone oxidoreductase subunit M, partial [Pseudomonadota bacterium]